MSEARLANAVDCTAYCGEITLLDEEVDPDDIPECPNCGEYPSPVFVYDCPGPPECDPDSKRVSDDHHWGRFRSGGPALSHVTDVG